MTQFVPFEFADVETEARDRGFAHGFAEGQGIQDRQGPAELAMARRRHDARAGGIGEPPGAAQCRLSQRADAPAQAHRHRRCGRRRRRILVGAASRPLAPSRLGFQAGGPGSPAANMERQRAHRLHVMVAGAGWMARGCWVSALRIGPLYFPLELMGPASTNPWRRGPATGFGMMSPTLMRLAGPPDAPCPHLTITVRSQPLRL